MQLISVSSKPSLILVFFHFYESNSLNVNKIEFKTGHSPLSCKLHLLCIFYTFCAVLFAKKGEPFATSETVCLHLFRKFHGHLFSVAMSIFFQFVFDSEMFSLIFNNQRKGSLNLCMESIFFTDR